MTTYQITAWCSVPHYTTFGLEASSIEEALAHAKIQVGLEYGEPCDGGGESDWNEFEITSDENDSESLTHLTPERSAEIAAPELLGSLQRGLAVAQDVVDFWERGDLAEAVRTLALWLADARSVIHQATKQ